jgi:hypothetical protein
MAVEYGTFTFAAGSEAGVTARSKRSYAPRSQPPPIGRAEPRWSVVSAMPPSSLHPAGSPASIAGLVVAGTIVGVGPPLSPRPPSCALVAVMTPTLGPV